MHTFINFKNFANANIELIVNPMTILIGRNGSGKSNIVEGIELLAQIAHGRPLYEISDLGRNGFEIRGGLLSCNTIGKSQNFTLGFIATYYNKNISYSITVSSIDKKIYYESLEYDNSNIFLAELKNSLDILDVKYNNFSRGKNKPTKQFPSDRSILSKYENIAASIKESPKQNEVLEAVKTIEYHLKTAFVFDVISRSMREFESIGHSILAKNGYNISSVLFNLSIHNPDALDRILDNIKQFPEEPFTDFKFITTSDNSAVLFGLKYLDSTEISAKLLSDGTLRTLAILTALETVPEGSRIIIEEIDNGVHASRVNVLIDAIWEASNRRHLNTLITTHNPATLDSLNNEQLECVVVCHYDKESQSAKLTPLLELPRADTLLEMEGLGNAVTHNIIEQHLKPDYENQQRKKTLDWLESLNG
jgi:predicted ATPase